MARCPATLTTYPASRRARAGIGYTSSATYDALNRIVTDTTPDASVTRHSYDEGGYLTKLEVQHRGSSTWTTVVHAVEHDAHGRRTKVERGDDGSGNAGLTTSYTYDPKSQRVTRIVTERSSDSAVLQDLRYHTDAVGLVTKVRDVSQQTHYYANAVVSADLDYHYDPLYRLVEASGRESTALGSTQHGATLPSMGPQPDASDPAAMRRYTQTYEYDPADNLIKLVHTPVGGTGWTRRYNYTTTGNRLQSTSISGDSPGATYTTPGTYTYSDHYEHDEHGSMTSMPHLPTMTWGHRDELTECTVGSETLHFQYAGGQRVRKHVIKTGSTTEERVYIGRYEKYTRRISGAEDMVRETLHLGDDLGRVAMVETKTVEGGAAVGSPTPMWRHPLGNMLGTAGGETTEDGSVIGYEEYHPYGTTAYRAKASGIDVSERRYRYTGMEQDEETGLGYHTARYYAGWLGRWVSADPIGLGGGGNRFGYADGRPTVLVDPGGMDPPNRTPTMWDSISAAAADPVGTASRFLERVERSLSGVPDTAESPSSPFDEQRRLEASASAAQSLPAVVLGAVAAAGIDIGRRTPDAVASVGDSTARGLRFAASIANSVVVEGGIKGDFSNDDSWAKLIGQTLVSGVPLLGTPADVRDVVANVKKGDLRGAAIAGVGIVLPFANLVNRARRSGKEGIEAGMESLADGVRGLDVGPTSRSAAKGGVEVLPGGARSQVEAARSFAGKLPSEASAKVPSSWGSATATKKGVGVRWSDPANPKGSGIRIDQGDPALPNPSQRVDHVVVRSEGKILGPDGNPIPGPLKDHPEAHIPLDVWKNWKTWNRP